MIFNGRVTQLLNLIQMGKSDDIDLFNCWNISNKKYFNEKVSETCSNKIHDRFAVLILMIDDQWNVTAINEVRLLFFSLTLPDDTLIALTMLDEAIQIWKVQAQLTLHRAMLKVGDVIKIAPSCDQTRHSWNELTIIFRFEASQIMPQSNPRICEIIKERIMFSDSCFIIAFGGGLYSYSKCWKCK